MRVSWVTLIFGALCQSIVFCVKRRRGNEQQEKESTQECVTEYGFEYYAGRNDEKNSRIKKERAFGLWVENEDFYKYNLWWWVILVWYRMV